MLIMKINWRSGLNFFLKKVAQNIKNVASERKKPKN